MKARYIPINPLFATVSFKDLPVHVPALPKPRTPRSIVVLVPVTHLCEKEPVTGIVKMGLGFG